MLKIPESCIDHARVQVTQSTTPAISEAWKESEDYKKAYSLFCAKEFELIKPYIGSPKNVLDLGCGIGRMSVYLHTQLRDDSIHYILADGNDESLFKIKYGWNNKKSRYYNSINLMNLFAESNGLKNFRSVNLQKESIEDLRNIDLIMSFLAVGFHFPIEEYLETLKISASSDCVMIFGIRKKSVYQTESPLFESFKYRKIIGSSESNENFLILTNRDMNDCIGIS